MLEKTPHHGSPKTVLETLKAGYQFVAGGLEFMNILTPCIKSRVAIARVTDITAVPRVATGGASGGATAILLAQVWQGLRLTKTTLLSRLMLAHLAFIGCFNKSTSS